MLLKGLLTRDLAELSCILRSYFLLTTEVLLGAILYVTPFSWMADPERYSLVPVLIFLVATPSLFSAAWLFTARGVFDFDLLDMGAGEEILLLLLPTLDGGCYF